MTGNGRRRLLPWALMTAIIAVGVTAIVEVGTHGSGQTAVSQVDSLPSPGTSVSPPSPSESSPASPTGSASSPSPVAAVRTPSPAPSTAASTLPKLSDAHPDYPPTETLVDKKDGLIVAVYTVQRGDYLSEIANRFQTQLTDVYVWSKDTVGPNADLIFSGQQIVVKVLGKL
jgi:LysM repeat protein